MRPVSFLICLCFLIAHLSAQRGARATVQQHWEIYFDFGHADVRSDADSVLREILAVAKDLPEGTIHIVAHTDSVGSSAANQKLSERRARATQHWLTQHAVAPDQISLGWKGEEVPQSSNASDAGRQLNRRATILLTLPKPMVSVSGLVTDSLQKALDALVVIHGKEFRDSVQTDVDGKFQLWVPDSAVLGIDVQARNHIYTSRMFNSTRIPTLDFRLKPAVPGTRFMLNNFYFVGNEDVLLQHSRPELRRLLQFMEWNPELHIEIRGHVNHPNRPPVSKESWEYGLSYRRAKRIYEFLVSNNVDSTRMIYNGYGNWEMVHPKARSEKYMRLNRRVEIEIRAH